MMNETALETPRLFGRTIYSWQKVLHINLTCAQRPPVFRDHTFTPKWSSLSKEFSTVKIAVWSKWRITYLSCQADNFFYFTLNFCAYVQRGHWNYNNKVAKEFFRCFSVNVKRVIVKNILCALNGIPNPKFCPFDLQCTCIYTNRLQVFIFAI